MSDVSVWQNGNLQTSRAPASGELLVGNGTDFTLSQGNITFGNPIVFGVPITVNGIVYSTSGGFKFPDGTTQASAAVSPPTTITDFISGVIAVPVNQDYQIILNVPVAITITSTTTICVSGTCTATFKIAGTAIGGSANAVSSSQQTQAHTTGNIAAAGQNIVLTISSNSSCSYMAFTMTFTRGLS